MTTKLTIAKTLSLLTIVVFGVLFINTSPMGLSVVPEQAQAGGGGGGGGCFVEGTDVQLADGTSKPIEAIVEGDVVLGMDGSVNTVIDTFTPLLGDRTLYSINGSEAFVTGGHPFLGVDGVWRSIDIVAAQKDNPNLNVEPLTEGDRVVTTAGIVRITDITASTHPSDTQLYNFHTDNTNSFIADSYVVHNKGGGGGGGGAGGSTGDAGGGIGGFGDGKSGDIDYDFNIPVVDQAPTIPTLSSSGSCVVNVSSVTLTMTATDPQEYEIRYQIDKDANGSIDQYVPPSGYVPSGTSQQLVYPNTTSGTQSVRVRAESDKGLVSGWSSNTVTVTCTEQPPPIVVDFCAY